MMTSRHLQLDKFWTIAGDTVGGAPRRGQDKERVLHVERDVKLSAEVEGNAHRWARRS